MRMHELVIAVSLAVAAAVQAAEPAVNAPAPETWTTGAYVYDGAGNITKIGGNAYAYDTAKRVRQYLPEAGGSQTFSYDSFGNVKRIDLVPPGGGSTISRIIPIESSSNQVGSSAGAVYDRAGNMLSHTGDTYKYDSQNMIVRLEGPNKKLAYVYSANDERIGIVNLLSKQWVWTMRGEDGRVLREYTSSGGTNGAAAWQWSRDHVYRSTSLLASEGVEGTRHYHLDHLGSPRLITNGTGVKTALHTYMPYGEEETSIRQDRERLRYTGHERDFNGGLFDENKDYLDYMHARYYNPTLARFTSVDPAGAKPGVPQSWNRYAYAYGNPIKFIDPSGRVVVLTGTNDRAQAELAAIRESLAHAQAASMLQITTGAGGARVLGVIGDLNSFAALSPTAATIAEAIRAEAMIYFYLGAMQYNSGRNAPAYTQPVDKKLRPHEQSRDSYIAINPAGLPLRTPDGTYENLSSVIQHEFGHAIALAYGRSGIAVGGPYGGTNAIAIDYENKARRWYREVYPEATVWTMRSKQDHGW